ncbi:hypothetical protein [Streptosporangium fragile]|uniref:hypothetical protein n=1 Tax=Streptosporangium fragile TaxID=46186 RepID=UPI0031EFCA2C
MGAAPLPPRHPVRLVAERAPLRGEPLLVRVSRWDRLKDTDGVLASFAAHVVEGYLALVGPGPCGIPGDIEQGVWFGRCLAAWRALPPAQRRRVGLPVRGPADLSGFGTLPASVVKGETDTRGMGHGRTGGCCGTSFPTGR